MRRARMMASSSGSMMPAVPPISAEAARLDTLWQRAAFFWMQRALRLAGREHAARDDADAGVRLGGGYMEVGDLNALMQTLEELEAGMTTLRENLARRDARIDDLEARLLASEPAAPKALVAPAEPPPRAADADAALAARVDVLTEQLRLRHAEKQLADTALSKLLVLSEHVSIALDARTQRVADLEAELLRARATAGAMRAEAASHGGYDQLRTGGADVGGGALDDLDGGSELSGAARGDSDQPYACAHAGTSSADTAAAGASELSITVPVDQRSEPEPDAGRAAAGTGARHPTASAAAGARSSGASRAPADARANADEPPMQRFDHPRFDDPADQLARVVERAASAKVRNAEHRWRAEHARAERLARRVDELARRLAATERELSRLSAEVGAPVRSGMRRSSPPAAGAGGRKAASARGVAPGSAARAVPRAGRPGDGAFQADAAGLARVSEPGAAAWHDTASAAFLQPAGAPSPRGPPVWRPLRGTPRATSGSAAGAPSARRVQR